MAAEQGPLYLGFDLSTQQLKGIVVQSDLKLIHEAKVDFDADFGARYGIHKGVLTNPAEDEVFAPVALFLDAIDLVLTRLRDAGVDFSRINGLSGAGMQHGTVFWSHDAASLLQTLDPSQPLTTQLEKAFAHPMSPNWQDASTQKQCDSFDAHLGSAPVLADVTGSKAHHRFSGPQIMRYRTKYPEHYAATARISLVSSFLASVFLGKVAPIDISDVGGMNLFDLHRGTWNDELLALAAGSNDAGNELRVKLGEVPADGGADFGSVSPYFVRRFGFAPDCSVIAFTGDNPATILALPLRPSDAIVSLGTSTTFLMSTPAYKPDPAYHFMNHPTTAGLYMFMLCYKNGGLAREHVRDEINSSSSSSAPNSWDTFNATATSTPPLAQKNASADGSSMRIGLYFPRPEIVPNVRAGQWRYSYNPSSHTLSPLPSTPTSDDARNIVESQFLSLRLRSHSLVQPDPNHPDLPAQPRRVYLVGGGSANPAIAEIAGQVLGGTEGVFKLDIGGNACALGAAYKAVWGKGRQQSETFEKFIEARWDEDRFVKKVAQGYTPGVFESYATAVKGFELMEQTVLEQAGTEKSDVPKA